MVRALIFLLFFTSSIIAQTADSSIAIFKIRPPEKRIRGFFCNPYDSIKPLYYFGYDGSIMNFGNQLDEKGFFNELILNQRDAKYELGEYFLERGSEKAVLTFPSKKDTSYLLGKYRSGRFYLAYSDTMIITDKWNVGSFIIAKSNEEKEEKKHQMTFMERSIFNKPCRDKTFWGGTIETIKLDLSDTLAYKRKKKLIEKIPEEDVKSFNGIIFEYYTDKFYTVFESDSQMVIGFVEDSCGSIQTQIDTFPSIPKASHWQEWYGAKNYLTDFDSSFVWAYRHDCMVELKFFSYKQLEKLTDEPNDIIFKRLKGIRPQKELTIDRICEVTF